MKKKLSWDKLPEAVGNILEIISSEESQHTAIPEMLQRLNLLEKKIDDLHRALSPDRPVMDMPAVVRALKLRPKAVHTLAESGALPYRQDGRKMLFYEDGVVKYFMTQPAWSSAVSTSVPEEPTPALPMFEGRQPIDMNAACAILGKTKGAVYQLTATKKIPFHKDGSKVYFFEDELREWLSKPRTRKPRQGKMQ